MCTFATNGTLTYIFEDGNIVITIQFIRLFIFSWCVPCIPEMRSFSVAIMVAGPVLSLSALLVHSCNPNMPPYATYEYPRGGLAILHCPKPVPVGKPYTRGKMLCCPIDQSCKYFPRGYKDPNDYCEEEFDKPV